MPMPNDPAENVLFDIDLLHDPDRATSLHTLAAHVQAASALARACYLLTEHFTPAADGEIDPRDRYALFSVVNAVADHASAAEVVLGALPSDLQAAIDRAGREPAAKVATA